MVIISVVTRVERTSISIESLDIDEIKNGNQGFIYLIGADDFPDEIQAVVVDGDVFYPNDELRKELAITDHLLEQRNKVLEAVPECPVHGNQCVPHAMEWIAQHMIEKPTHYIWWLSQRACRELDDLDLTHLPDYIQTQFTSRNGRNGRGRLWVASHIDIEEIEWLEKPGAWLASDCGGIVIETKDLESVFGLPGFVTDLRLNVVNEI